MSMSEENLKYLCNLFIGDIENLYQYKSGPKIFSFFNKYFSYNDTYSFREKYPSRWMIVYNKLVELINGGKLNKFLSIMFSLTYLKTEFPDKNYSELENISNSALIKINNVFENDGLKITKFSDNFQLVKINEDEEFLGEGGYACCYYIKSAKMVEKRLKEDNYLDTGVIHRFKREFTLTKSLNDIKGIIKVYSLDEKRLSYTMEKGECDLYSYVINNKLDDNTKKILIYQINHIMKQVHDRGAIHRDLSPNNIFIISGLIRIADFGLGKDLNAFYSHQTMKTNSVGQYYYCDPRQFMKLKDGDKKSDIYSIGKIINFIYNKDPNDNSHKYYSVVEKATCPDEKYRYSSINDLMVAIKRIDEIEAKGDFEKKFIEKLNSGVSLEEEDIFYICSFNDEKMFEMIENVNFRIAFVEAREKEYIDETTFLNKLSELLKFYKNAYGLKWTDYDKIGYLGSTILLSNKCSYIAKEFSIEFINYPISANRFDFIRMTKNEILGNIDPTLEEKIDKKIYNY